MSNISLKLIKFGIGFILFIPLYIGGSFFFPFIFPKIWLFQLMVEIILFFYIILAISDNRYLPKLNLITYALSALTIILIITSFTGVDAYRSFWGNTERMSGILAWFHFVAFALILSGVFSPYGRSPEGGKTEKEWRNFFGIAVVVSILQFFYVLAQYFNVSWVWMPQTQIGTIGNADLLGSYAIFSAFFALYLWRSNLNYKWLWATAFFLNIGTLYFAGSRGAMLGFFSGMFVYMAFSVWQKSEAQKIWAAIVLIAILAYGILWLSRDTDFVKNNYQLGRITHISLQDTTVQQRFVEWGIAWNAFKSRPIFGFGPNNYLYLHNAFLNPRLYILQETNFDRAHNAYLDYASMNGIFGLTAYAFLISALFAVFWKRKLWVFASFIIAYAVQSFFVFDSPATYIALFLTIGFAMFVENSSIPRIEESAPPRRGGGRILGINFKQNSNFSSQTILTLSTLYLILTIFFIWQVSIKPAIANYKFTIAFSGASAGTVTPENAFKLYKESLKYETLGTTEFRNQYITWLQANLGKFNPENRLEVLDFGIGELKKEVKNHPLVFSFLNLGQMYSYKARGIVGSDEVKLGIYTLAANAYDNALELAPGRLEVYYSYLQWSFDTKNHNKGVELMKKAVVAAPNYWQTHWYLGIANIANGNDAEAVKAINQALVIFYGPKISALNGRLKFDVDEIIKSKRSFSPKQEILGAVNPYIRLKMWPELLLLYLSAAAGDPGDIQIHQSLALVYQNLGLTEKVNEELKIVDKLSKDQSGK
ncbi:MAG: O-antigen ligase family protein [Candidatus Azambacteria bacterium]|nr:O-antigen ligase family protein [Candidatus Azambacteria bacterium]